MQPPGLNAAKIARDLVRAMIRARASSIFMCADSPISVSRNGEEFRLSTRDVSNSDLRLFIYSFLDSKALADLESLGIARTTLDVPGLGVYRVEASFREDIYYLRIEDDGDGAASMAIGNGIPPTLPEQGAAAALEFEDPRITELLGLLPNIRLQPTQGQWAARG
jgi:uncharacterized protein (DUF1684 family)